MWGLGVEVSVPGSMFCVLCLGQVSSVGLGSRSTAQDFESQVWAQASVVWAHDLA